MYPILRDSAPDAVGEFRDFGVDHFASGVLFKCNMPAAMMEPLFMSHPAEAELLVQSIYDDPSDGVFSAGCVDYSCRRGEIAQAIYEGVLNYYGDDAAPFMHVSAIAMSYTQRRYTYFVYTHVDVLDNDEGPVPGATIALAITLPDGSTIFKTGITGDDGPTTFKVRSELTGIYESAVTSISKSGWVYDPAGNHETSEVLTVR